jgi:glycosyltransferase involved in cell wall biosynthesis
MTLPCRTDGKTLRVALVALFPAPGAKAPGGVRVVVQNLLQGLRSYDDLQIDVVHCHSDIDQSLAAESGNTRIHYLAMPRRRLLPNTLASIRRVEQMLRKIQPDVVNAHAAHYAIAGLRAGRPTIYTIHGVIHREAQVYQSRWFDRIRYWLESACDRYAVSHVSDIVAISPYVLEEYRHSSHACFHRIDNPLPSQFFEIPNAEERGQLLYPGTIDERKNVLGLLQALVLVRQQIPDVQLRIAGRATSSEYYRQCQDFVAEHGLERNVTFLGLQASPEMMKEYAHCAAVLLASWEETAPMVVIEAMAAGKPIVATQVGGVADLMAESRHSSGEKGGASGFLVDPGDMQAFAQRVVLLLQDDDLRRRMGDRARQSAARFRVEPIAAKYRQLYYQIAGRELP